MTGDWDDPPGGWHDNVPDDGGTSDSGDDGGPFDDAVPADLLDGPDIGSGGASEMVHGDVDGPGPGFLGESTDYDDGPDPGSGIDYFGPDHVVIETAADPPPRRTDGWTDAIGAGGADPTGAAQAAFGHLDLVAPADVELPGSAPDWISASNADLDGWTQTSLLEDRPATPPSVTATPAVIESLWERLSPGEAMPTTASGGSDLDGALDVLAARSASPAMRDVLDAVRRLVGE